MKKLSNFMVAMFVLSGLLCTNVTVVEAQELQNETSFVENTSRAGVIKSLTRDIYKYDAGAGKYLTYINGIGYSQYSYLNKKGTYAFTPSSWMSAAGLKVTKPSSSNDYKMTISNPYTTYKTQAKTALTKYRNGQISKAQLEVEYNKLAPYIKSYITNPSYPKVSSKATLTRDIYRYDGGSTRLTSINDKGYSQYTYLNTKGTYAFTPSSWMKTAGLTVTMPTKSNGYMMEINNTHVLEFNNTMKEIKSILPQVASPENMVINELYRLVNEHRVSNGLKALTATTKLEKMSVTKSEHMVKHGYFNHRYDGKMIWEAFPELGNMTGMWAENISMVKSGALTTSNAKTIATNTFNKWKSSSVNNQNMLSANFKTVGFGIDLSSNGYTYGTIIFSSEN